MKKIHPDFVIVGAPKSGTTALFNYLNQHSNIFMPEKKEPVFFCGYEKKFQGPGSQSLNEHMVVEPDDYLDLYSRAPEGAISGEASTDYLSCRDAAPRIKAWNPDAKIIICLRNPIDRAYSEHMHLARDLLETEEFGTALKLEKNRRAKWWIPLFWHVERGLYYESVKRYLELFGEENVKIIFHEEMLQSSRAVVNSLFKFLNVERLNVEVSRPYNVSGHPRLGVIQQLILTNNCLKRVFKQLTSKELRLYMKRILSALNLRKTSMQEDDFLYLRENFKTDIYNLQELLNVDLKPWVGDRSI